MREAESFPALSGLRTYPAPQSKDDKIRLLKMLCGTSCLLDCNMCLCGHLRWREEQERFGKDNSHLYLLGWRPTGIRLVAIDVEGSLQLGVAGTENFTGNLGSSKFNKFQKNCSLPSVVGL